VIEGANGPTTAGAETTLIERGVIVVPDILANVGGVIASYFEWVQALQALTWHSSEAVDRLALTIRESFEAVAAYADDRDITLREASLCLAIRRVADAHVTRGLYP
jgi:glutamate dehydrogenase (NAD(P)+)